MLKDKLKGMLYGGIVGDILGVPFEFKDRGTFNCTDMIGYGTHNQPVGTWSDDTSMTLATIDNIINYGNINDLMRRFSNWFMFGDYTPSGICLDIGNTVMKSIEDFDNGILNCGQCDEYDNGNGALMRISPIITLLNFKSNVNLFMITNEYTSLTHSHPRSVVASLIYLLFLNELHNTHKANVISKVEGTLKKCKNKIPKSYSDEFKTYTNIFSGELLNRKYEELKSSGYVVDTLESAIWCFYYSNSFEDAVLKAVNLGGDTDTIASITGSLVGIYYGYDSIPKEWINKIVKKDYIDTLIEEYLERID